MSWKFACLRNQVSEDNPLHVELMGLKIGIFQIESDYFAIENVCPHAYALLTQGFIEDDTVECPLHEAIFNIRTGNLIKGPECRNLNRYSTKVDGDQILIQLENK